MALVRRIQPAHVNTDAVCNIFLETMPEQRVDAIAQKDNAGNLINTKWESTTKPSTELIVCCFCLMLIALSLKYQ